MPVLQTYNQIDQALGRYPLIRTLFEMAERRGTPIYLVGGTVRDLLCGRETHDLDFAVEGSGLALARHAANQLQGYFVPLDAERRTGRVLLPRPSPAEHVDIKYPPTPPPQYLDIASLRGDGLLTDLQGRDFTLNAIAIGPAAGAGWRFHDPLDGIEDLRQASLRMASPTSFEDDPVRTLRAVRLQVQFGLHIEAETRRQLRAAVPLLGRISAERIRDEWFKLLALPGAATALDEMAQLGLLYEVAPPLDQADLAHALATVDALERLWTAFKTMDAQEAPTLPLAHNLRQLGPPIRHRYTGLICDERSYLALLKCAALLHSAGADPATLAERWRLSKREAELLQTAMHHYPDVATLAEQADTSGRAIYRFFSQTGEPGIDSAILSLAHTLAERGGEQGRGNWMLQTQTVGRLLEAWFEHQGTLIAPAPLLSGRDVMQALDLSPGPRIGELLRGLAEEQAAGEILTRQQALAYIQRWKTRG